MNENFHSAVWDEHRCMAVYLLKPACIALVGVCIMVIVVGEGKWCEYKHMLHGILCSLLHSMARPPSVSSFLPSLSRSLHPTLTTKNILNLIANDTYFVFDFTYLSHYETASYVRLHPVWSYETYAWRLQRLLDYSNNLFHPQKSSHSIFFFKTHFELEKKSICLISKMYNFQFFGLFITLIS